MKKYLSLLIAATLCICVLTACSPALKPSSAPSCSDPVSSDISDIPYFPHPAADPGSAESSVPESLVEPQVYTPDITRVDLSDTAFFDKSKAEKVAGTDTLYWYVTPQYDYDDMQPIGWSDIWMAEKDGQCGAVDIGNRIVLPVEQPYSYDCHFHTIRYFVPPGIDWTVQYTVSYDGAFVVESPNHGHGGSFPYWDTKAGRSVSMGEGSWEYASYQNPTIVSGLEITGDDVVHEPDEIKFGICQNDTLTVPLVYDYIRENFNLEKYSYNAYRIDSEGLLQYTPKEHLFDPPQTLYAAKKDGRAGYIDMNNNVIIPFIFEETTNFMHGAAAVRLDGKWGIVVLF